MVFIIGLPFCLLNLWLILYFRFFAIQRQLRRSQLHLKRTDQSFFCYYSFFALESFQKIKVCLNIFHIFMLVHLYVIMPHQKYGKAQRKMILGNTKQFFTYTRYKTEYHPLFLFLIFIIYFNQFLHCY